MTKRTKKRGTRPFIDELCSMPRKENPIVGDPYEPDSDIERDGQAVLDHLRGASAGANNLQLDISAIERRYKTSPPTLRELECLISDADEIADSLRQARRAYFDES